MLRHTYRSAPTPPREYLTSHVLDMVKLLRCWLPSMTVNYHHWNMVGRAVGCPAYVIGVWLGLEFIALTQ